MMPQTNPGFSMTTRLEGPAPELEISRDMIRRGLIASPVLIAICGAIWGMDGVWSSAYGIALADEVVKVLGAKVVGQGAVTTGASAFPITEVKSSGATALFYGGYTAEASKFLSQLKDAGWGGTFVGGDGINDSNMLAIGKEKIEGTVATCPCAPATSATPKFVTDYKPKYSADPGVYADVAFDLANVFLDGIAAGKTTRPDMLAFVNSYDKKGAATGVQYKWVNGELDLSQVLVWAFKAKDGAWIPDQLIPKS